jgi:hypothetical protein
MPSSSLLALSSPSWHLPPLNLLAAGQLEKCVTYKRTAHSHTHVPHASTHGHVHTHTLAHTQPSPPSLRVEGVSRVFFPLPTPFPPSYPLHPPPQVVLYLPKSFAGHSDNLMRLVEGVDPSLTFVEAVKRIERIRPFGFIDQVGTGHASPGSVAGIRLSALLGFTCLCCWKSLQAVEGAHSEEEGS